ncbi:hypothetical protein K439DRAFT_1628693 [Ramaria rubella]|nr:hypothetical protein K439DRAFT_1628693 [Ramaria rubella]
MKLLHTLLLSLFGPMLSVLADTALNVNSTKNPTSRFDPFEQLRIRVTPKPSEPVCCLIPSSSEPLPTTAEFISFEEWKSKQREMQAANKTPSPDTLSPEAYPGSSVVAPAAPSGEGDSSLPPVTEAVSVLSPHFRVPLTDRFNYASLDCSARVHSSHRAARSPSAILSSKKDRYMLSPCSTAPNFVVVELCDDIRIDTVQLANFEFFSGVFRDFKVSVAQTYSSDGNGWIEAGTYRAKNIRGVQSFHPLVELRPFYRYIRIDFLTHYGGEFYCPVSLLRVYGLTQMEEWKWEVWQGTSEAPVFGPDNGERFDIDEFGNETGIGSPTTITAPSVVEAEELPTETPIEQTFPLHHLEHTPVLTKKNVIETLSPPTDQLELQSTSVHSSFGPKSSSIVSDFVILDPNTSASTVSVAYNRPDRDIKIESNPFSNSSLTTTTINTSSIGTPEMFLPVSPSGSMQSLIPLPSPSLNPSGESIYRTIMNRLAMLETNTTLYQKYVEEQTLQVRETLRRLEEDIGRLEGISKAQQHTFSRTMYDLEHRRHQMEDERRELLNQVNHLTDEVVLEKRLGIAQLCLLLTVLVFMALTRGSRTDAISLLDGTMHRLNSFSRRSWSSADWTQRRWASRSPTPTSGGSAIAKKEAKREARSVTVSPLRRETVPPFSVPLPTTPPMRSQTPRSHLRRPTGPRYQDIGRLGGSERPTGRLRRSNSHTTPASTVLSARRFARSAHLHEISLRRRTTTNGSDSDTQSGEEIGVPGPNLRPTAGPSTIHGFSGHSVSAPKRPVSEEHETDTWIDTEGEPSNDLDDMELEEIGGQEAEHQPERSTLRNPILFVPPANHINSDKHTQVLRN